LLDGLIPVPRANSSVKHVPLSPDRGNTSELFTPPAIR
jgi:hypothetical protein